MKKLIEKMKVHKKLVILIAIAVVVFLVVLLLPKGKVTPPSTVSTKPPVVVVKNELKLLEVAPEQGAREDVDQFSPIAIRLSEVPDIKSIKYAVSPKMELKFRTYSESPDAVWITPANPWAKGVTYTITIKEVKSIQGSVFQGPYTYTLSNTPPEVVEAGDPYTPPIEP